MITIKEHNKTLPVIQTDNYGAFFEQEQMKFLSGSVWKKIMDSFWQEMRLHVSPNDVEELVRFLRNKRETILEGYKNEKLFHYWKDSFNGSTKQHDKAKFIKILDAVFDGQIDRADLDAFFSWHCLTTSIDVLLGKVLEQQKFQRGTTINFFYNDGGEINFGSSVHDKKGNSSMDVEPLKNYIFNDRIFDSNIRFSKLRDTIASAIDMGDATIMYGKPQELRINPMVQNEWYYILKAISESGVAKSKISDTLFVEQMVEWFPMLFPDETPEKFKEYKRRLLKSISAERRIWKQGRMNLEVSLKEMWAKGISNRLGTAKAERVYEIAYKGLYLNLTALKQDIAKEMATR